MADEIRRKIAERKSEALGFVKSLIRVPTINPPGENYERIVALIRKELPKNMKATIYSKNGKPNLVARWDVGARKTLHVNGHYDVVPATAQSWKHSPFEPIVEGNKLFGRGSQDMKSSLAAMVYAVRILDELRLKPACNIELSFTCDEESGGIDGAGFLVKEKKVKPDYAITMDGPVAQLNNSHKGVLALEITVIGKSCHAAWPHNGVNAFVGACKLAGELDRMNLKLSKLKSKLEAREEIGRSPTLVVGGIAKGGTKFNTVPGEFSFTIDRRIIPEERMKDAKKQVEQVIQKFKKANPRYKVTLKILLEAEPAQIRKDAKICKVVSESVRKVKGASPRFAMLSGFLDMRFFVNDARIDCINYGVDGGNLHGDDEFVYVSTIFENIEILARTFLNRELAK